jgi:hypothetical protein
MMFYFFAAQILVINIQDTLLIGSREIHCTYRIMSKLSTIPCAGIENWNTSFAQMQLVKESTLRRIWLLPPSPRQLGELEYKPSVHLSYSLFSMIASPFYLMRDVVEPWRNLENNALSSLH